MFPHDVHHWGFFFFFQRDNNPLQNEIRDLCGLFEKVTKSTLSDCWNIFLSESEVWWIADNIASTHQKPTRVFPVVWQNYPELSWRIENMNGDEHGSVKQWLWQHTFIRECKTMFHARQKLVQTSIIHKYESCSNCEALNSGVHIWNLW